MKPSRPRRAAARALCHLGHRPQDVQSTPARSPIPARGDPARREAMERASSYLGARALHADQRDQLDAAFFGSCTNTRIEDLRAAAKVVQGRKVAPRCTRWSCRLRPDQAPGRGGGTRPDFIDAGFEWREAGCSMCLGMNPDQLRPGERCASTSNRNFEGRRPGRPHPSDVARDGRRRRYHRPHHGRPQAGVAKPSTHPQPAAVQSSQTSPGTRANSATFAVTSVAPARRACAAISRS